MAVEEGRPAPDFTLPTDTGEPLTLSDLRGRPVVLYFYPRDDTCAIYDSSTASSGGPERKIIVSHALDARDRF